MTRVRGNRLGIVPGMDGRYHIGVTEIMKAIVGEIGGFQHLMQDLPDRRLGKMAAVRMRENQIREIPVVPRRPKRQFSGSLDGFVPFQHFHQEGTLGRKYVIIGLVKNIRNIITKSNSAMGVVTIETFDGDLPVVFFSNAWKEYHGMIVEDKALAFTGQIDLRNPDSPQLRGETVQEIEDFSKSHQGASQVHIKIDEPFTEQQLEKLKDFMLDHEGGCSVFLHIKDSGKETVVQVTHQIKVKSDFDVPEESELRKIITDIWKE